MIPSVPTCPLSTFDCYTAMPCPQLYARVLCAVVAMDVAAKIKIVVPTVLKMYAKQQILRQIYGIICCLSSI